MKKNLRRKRIETGLKNEKIKCAECGSEHVATSNEEYKFPYFSSNDSVELSTKVPVRKCEDCGFRYLDKAAEKLCHDKICEYLGVMKPSQIKALRDYYGLSQAEFSKITGIGEATLSRWERGIVIQNEAYDKYLYLLGFKENVEKIQTCTKSTKTEKQYANNAELPSFRELDVTEELLERQSNFKLNPC